MVHIKIAEFVRANKGKFTYKDIAIRFKLSENAVRGIIGRAYLRDHVVKRHWAQPSSLTQEKVMKTKQQLGVEARLESQLRAKSKAEKEQDRKYRVLQDELLVILL